MALGGTRRDVRTPLCRAFGPKLPRRTGFNHAGGGTPAHCDASRISAGVHFRESALARRNHAKHFQNLPTMCSKGLKSSQISPQTLPKPSQNLPKASQNPSRSPLGAHFEPMLERSSILNAQKTAKRRSKAPKGGPRQPQTPSQIQPKTIPKLIFVGFLDAFCPAPNLHRFFLYF